MLLAGVGVLLIMAATILSLLSTTAAFSRAMEQMGRTSLESRQIWVIERKINEISQAVQNFVLTGDKAYEDAYENAKTDADEALSTFAGHERGQDAHAILTMLNQDLERMKTKAERILSLRSRDRAESALAADLLDELNSLHTWMRRDIGKFQEINAAQTGKVRDQLRRNKVTINLVFLLVLLTSLGSLAAFAAYIHRKVTVPLRELRDGTEEISRGNLDYRMQVHGEGDIARLGERFNEMAGRLRVSYAELAQKLYDRTRELASLDAVALTLSQAGTLRDMLDKSLLRILDSLVGIDAKGGVFLCEPGGQTLRLMAQKGLSHEFMQREGVIKMGECLCGMVAQSGELLFTEHGCKDPRHTRGSAEEDHSHIIIPIKSRGIVLGVIFLYPQRNFKLKPPDIQMLDAIGAQMGMAVENFRFYAEVKESSEKYWDLFENATDILFTMDGTGKLTAVNKAAEIFTGYSKVELYGKSIFDFLTPEGVAAARKLLESAFDGRQWTEFEVVKPDGSRAFIEASARRLIRKQQSAGYQVSARDVTGQKQLREMLVQAERIGAIGQVGVAVRHEINNPLTTVIGNIELLMERYESKDKDLTARLETILNNALRIAEIVKQLQVIKKDKVVEYLKGVKMTDLKQK